MSTPVGAHAPSSAAAPAPDPPPPAPRAEPRTASPAIRLKLPSYLPDIDIEPGLDIIAAYALKVNPGEGGAETTWFHAFEMSRAMPSLRIAAGPATAGLMLEGVYSASEGALIGVAGDSFVLRVREARAGYRYKEWVAVDAGIVPTFTIPLLDESFGLRALGPVSAELTGFSSPADLGVVGRFSFPKQYGFIGAGAYNGEGYTNRELNRGKNIEVAALVRPVPRGILAPLAAYGAYVNGSSGTGLARADRGTAALLWTGERVRGGASMTYALGVRDDGQREALSLDWSLRGEPIERLIVGTRGFLYVRDMKSTEDRILSITGLAGFRVAPPLEVFLAVTRQLPEGAARSALPGSDLWEGRLAARFKL
ncbi:MAG: hypothetical protein R3B70_09155 [Polyangiaceae bacterium]